MIRAAITLALGFWTLNAAAGVRVLEQLEQPYELDLAAVKMPDSTVGTVSFKTCSTCQLQFRSVYVSTRYFVNGRELAFKDFLPAVANIRASSDGSSPFVGIFVDLQSKRVNRIIVSQSTDK